MGADATIVYDKKSGTVTIEGVGGLEYSKFPVAGAPKMFLDELSKKLGTNEFSVFLQFSNDVKTLRASQFTLDYKSNSYAFNIVDRHFIGSVSKGNAFANSKPMTENDVKKLFEQKAVQPKTKAPATQMQ